MKRNHCKECAAGKSEAVSCCVSPFKDEVPGIFLTFSDIARIVKSTGRKPGEFCRIVDFSEETYEEPVEDKCSFIDEKLEFADKSILMNGKHGKCFFLGKKGCTIFDSRPKMCKIHPFWFKVRGKDFKIITEWNKSVEAEECLIGKEHHKCRNLSQLLKHIGETRKSMNDSVKELIKELDLHEQHKWELEKKSILKVLIENGFI